MNNLTQKDKKNLVRAIQQGRPFLELMAEYSCAIMEIETKLKVLNSEFSLYYDRNPFESIKTRLKSPMSIVKKLEKKGCEISVENMEKQISDIAGIRVICSFPDDIYRLARLLESQDDITLIREKDYIKNPKPNGYRSLHLILEIPIFLSGGKKYRRVEVQFRTIAMDFWASLDHKLRYKKDLKNPEGIAQKLKTCADAIARLDLDMQQIRNDIEDNSKDKKET